MKDDLGPKSFLAKYHDLNAAVCDLTNLAGMNPQLVQDIIELAMVMAIHAEQKKSKALYFDTSKLEPEWDKREGTWEGFKK